MSSPVISVEKVSKQYRLGEVGTGTLSHDLNRWWHKVRGKEDPYLRVGESNDRSKKGDSEYSWALRDVSFEVKQSEVLGIIGRNGAGKSTLLKILSRVTTPTTGHIKVKGRIGSLLEVGTGFHPELTGRENIFLNGAILGMRKAEIAAKLDEIIDFSGCERYIDTPVKRYSSGMYVRLAFAVAAHLESEILILDEVLAVGDAEFQKKCLGKMKDVAGHGRTVLFVSHNLAAMRNLCSSCVWMDCGSIRGYGNISKMLDEYVRSSAKIVNAAEVIIPVDATKPFQVLKARVTRTDGVICSEFTCDDEICLEFICEVRESVPGLYGYLQISRRDGTEILVSDSFDSGENPMDGLLQGLHTLRISLPLRCLGAAEYVVYLNFTSPMGVAGFAVDSPGDLLSFRIDDPNSRRSNNRGGFFATLLPWQISPHSPVLVSDS